MKASLLALIIAVGTGCAAPAPYEQKIDGVLTKEGVPVVGIKARFISEYPEDTCEAVGFEATTDHLGEFSFSQQYTPSTTERYAVVIHPYRLCISNDGHWKTIWKETTGPAPKSIALRCNLDSKGGAECLVSWNGKKIGKW